MITFSSCRSFLISRKIKEGDHASPLLGFHPWHGAPQIERDNGVLRQPALGKSGSYLSLIDFIGKPVMFSRTQKPIIMRAILFLLVGGIFAQAQPVVTGSPAQKAEALFAKGIAAEKAGDPITAKAAFAAALEANPNHAQARFRLGEMKIHGESISKKGREAKFGQTVIPVFQLEGATLQESLDALSTAMEKASEGAEAPSFIIEDTGNRLGEAKISLQLKGTPARGILDYILTQSRAKARHDEHAVVILPR